MKKKFLKENVIKRLQKEAGDLWKKVCKKRDNGCQILAFYPGFCLCKNERLQVHHIFSRTKKNIFLDVENGITLGVKCHCKVTWDDGYKEIIRRIVTVKSKIDYDRLYELSLAKGSFLKWKNITWLEEQIEYLQGLLK